MTKKVAINQKRTSLLKSALKPWKRFEPTANFLIFKIRSIYSLRMIENDCVKATYHQLNIQKHITDFSNNKTAYYTQYR